MIQNVNLSNLSITKSSSIAACFRSRVRNGDIVFGDTALKLTVPKIACNTKLDYIQLLYDLRNLVNFMALVVV